MIRLVDPEKISRRVEEGEAPATGILVQFVPDAATGGQNAAQGRVHIVGSHERQNAVTAGR